MPLRRADRLFDILRVLRAASRPVTAASLAADWKSRCGRHPADNRHLEPVVRLEYLDAATPPV
jgi:hypothetical protein